MTDFEEYIRQGESGKKKSQQQIVEHIAHFVAYSYFWRGKHTNYGGIFSRIGSDKTGHWEINKS